MIVSLGSSNPSYIHPPSTPTDIPNKIHIWCDEYNNVLRYNNANIWLKFSHVPFTQFEVGNRQKWAVPYQLFDVFFMALSFTRRFLSQSLYHSAYKAFEEWRVRSMFRPNRRFSSQIQAYLKVRSNFMKWFLYI